MHKLGEQSFTGETGGFTTGSDTRWNLGKRIANRLPLRKFTEVDIERLYSRMIDDDSEGKGKSQPLVTIHIYCSPCVCQIETAYDLCTGFGISPLFDFVIRIDDRIPVDCCSESTGIHGLVSLNNRMKEIRTSDYWPLGDPRHKAHYVDRPWIERRIYEVEQETYQPSYWHDPTRNVNRILREVYDENLAKAVVVILAEYDYCSLLMESSPFPQEPRKPRETEIFEFHYWNAWVRTYVGAYCPRKEITITTPTSSAPRSELIYPVVQDVPT